jgi:hypothetical protein
MAGKGFKDGTGGTSGRFPRRKRQARREGVQQRHGWLEAKRGCPGRRGEQGFPLREKQARRGGGEGGTSGARGRWVPGGRGKQQDECEGEGAGEVHGKAESSPSGEEKQRVCYSEPFLFLQLSP